MMHPVLYDMPFLSYLTSRYAQEVRRTTNVPFFRPSHLGKGTRWRVPIASPRLVAQLRHRAFLRQPTVYGGRSHVRVMAPDTRQSEERSCSSDTSMTEGDCVLPLDSHWPTVQRVDAVRGFRVPARTTHKALLS